MSAFEIWSLIISAFGFLLVIASIGILIYQTRILVKSLDVSSNSSVGERQLEVDKIFVENPHLLKYFFNNVDISPSHDDYEAALAITLMLANFYDTFLLQEGNFQQMYPVDSWSRYIKDYFAKSPILRNHVEEYKSWYTPGLLALKQSADVSHEALTSQL